MLGTLAGIGTVTSAGLLWRLKKRWESYHRGHIQRLALVRSVMWTGGVTLGTVLLWVGRMTTGF